MRRCLLTAVVLTCLFTGCRTVDYPGGVLIVWIPDSCAGRGYPAQVVLPPSIHATNAMDILVDGMIEDGGIHRMRVGSTVLQAVQKSGGFIQGAATTKLYIGRSSGQTVRLYLQSRRPFLSRFPQVWYDTNPDGHLGFDYVLSPGDQIRVMRCLQ